MCIMRHSFLGRLVRVVPYWCVIQAEAALNMNFACIADILCQTVSKQTST